MMDLSTPPPPPSTTAATAIAIATTVKTPDLETETPQSNTITKHLPPPLTNGVLKRHKPLHHQPLAPLTAPTVAYKECLKNHAAAIGGHAVDGCGEFMPSPASSPTYPTSLKCAACGCHRNFHRREPEEPPAAAYLHHHHPPIQHVIEYQPIHRHHPPPPPPPQPLPPPPGAVAGDGSGSPGNSPSPPPISSSYYPSAPHMLLALSTGLSPETHHHPPISAVGAAVHGGAGAGKKRFRTKFTQNQKEKMHEIAEKVGWKMQKRDEEMIVGFCNEIGVEKGVFKVWMHNNKTTFGNKKEFSNDNGNGNGIDFIISRNHNNDDDRRREVAGDFNDRREVVAGNLNDHHLHLHDSYSKGGIVICTKGSSSSS